MAFVQVVQDVRDYLALRGFAGVEVTSGADARVAQPNGDGSANRIAFVPVASVETAAPRFIGEGLPDEDGGVRRALVDATVIFDVCFAGFDHEKVEAQDADLYHRRAAFGLWELAVQAIQRSYYGAHEWRGARWDDARKHGRHGAELIATLAVSAPLFDAAWTTSAPSPIPGLPKPAPTPDP